ncbi:MAG: hypothetical protein KAS93_06310 [Gammaproteobacteria bacterium]|nr:hypothetical protein [Gammaproteobacteria bacterium]
MCQIQITVNKKDNRSLVVAGSCTGDEKSISTMLLSLKEALEKNEARVLDLSGFTFVCPEKSFAVCLKFLTTFLSNNTCLCEIKWPEIKCSGGSMRKIFDELMLNIRCNNDIAGINEGVVSIGQRCLKVKDRGNSDDSWEDIYNTLALLVQRINKYCSQNLGCGNNSFNSLKVKIRGYYQANPLLVLMAVELSCRSLDGYSGLMQKLHNDSGPPLSSVALISILAKERKQSGDECEGGHASKNNISKFFSGVGIFKRRSSQVTLSSMISFMFNNEFFWREEDLLSVDQVKRVSSLPATPRGAISPSSSF